jgi:uncharacterized protein (TIGR03435 family)
MKWLPLAALLSASVFAQSPGFEVATISPSPGARRMGLNSVTIDESRVRINAVTLTSVIAMAFHVHPSQVIGPDWLTTTGFTIVAKIPGSGSAGQVPEMLQNLLKERFGMKVHTETRDLPAYILTAGKRPLPPLDSSTPEFTADSAGDGARAVQTPFGEMKMTVTGNSGQLVGSGLRVLISGGHAQLEMTRVAMLAKALSADMDIPVVDQTGLTGRYKIVLATGGANVRPPLNPDVPSNPAVDAVEDQLGLKMTRGKAPLEAIVIDQIEKTPTEN